MAYTTIKDPSEYFNTVTYTGDGSADPSITGLGSALPSPVEVTTWDQHQIPTLNFASALAGFGGITMKWGSYDATYHGYSGYLAECNYVDGVTATQNDFGVFDGDSGISKSK
jgi:hypothetical protein